MLNTIGWCSQEHKWHTKVLTSLKQLIEFSPCFLLHWTRANNRFELLWTRNCFGLIFIAESRLGFGPFQTIFCPFKLIIVLLLHSRSSFILFFLNCTFSIFIHITTTNFSLQMLICCDNYIFLKLRFEDILNKTWENPYFKKITK